MLTYAGFTLVMAAADAGHVSAVETLLRAKVRMLTYADTYADVCCRMRRMLTRQVCRNTLARQGTHVTCVTTTEGQILTPEPLRMLTYADVC